MRRTSLISSGIKEICLKSNRWEHGDPYFDERSHGKKCRLEDTLFLSSGKKCHLNDTLFRFWERSVTKMTLLGTIRREIKRIRKIKSKKREIIAPPNKVYAFTYPSVWLKFESILFMIIDF